MRVMRSHSLVVCWLPHHHLPGLVAIGHGPLGKLVLHLGEGRPQGPLAGCSSPDGDWGSLSAQAGLHGD